MILFWRYFLPGSICQVIRMWPEVVCTRVGHVGVSQVASPWLCGWRETDVGLQRLLSPRLDTNMKAALLLCLFVYRLKQHPTYFQCANHFVATPFLSHHRYMKTAVRIETSIKRRFIWWLSTWLLFAVHTTQEPNQNIWWPHDKKWRIAHGQDCAGPQHVRRNIPIPRTNVDKLYISPGSFLSCVLWYHCACDLTRFRYRNHLVKISGEKKHIFVLKYLFLPVAAYMAGGVLRSCWKHFVCHRKHGWKFSWGLQWCCFQKFKSCGPSSNISSGFTLSSVIYFHLYHFLSLSVFPPFFLLLTCAPPQPAFPSTPHLCFSACLIPSSV